MGHYNSFLVKVWTDADHELTRGYVQHVGTGEIVYFLDWGKMVDFIVNHLNWNISYPDVIDEIEQTWIELQSGENQSG